MMRVIFTGNSNLRLFYLFFLMRNLRFLLLTSSDDIAHSCSYSFTNHLLREPALLFDWRELYHANSSFDCPAAFSIILLFLICRSPNSSNEPVQTLQILFVIWNEYCLTLSSNVASTCIASPQ